MIDKQDSLTRLINKITVNVDIFAQLNFLTLSPMEHIYSCVLNFAPVNSICSIMIIIFVHIKYSRIYSYINNNADLIN